MMKNDGTAHSEVSIESIVDRHADDLFRWAYHRTSSRENAEDLVQETLIAAFKSIHNFRNESKIKTWLFSILNNKIIDFHRKKYRENTFTQTQLSQDTDSENIVQQVFDSHGNWKLTNADRNLDGVDEHLLDNDEFREVFQDCLQDLPDKWFSVVQLKFLMEKNGEEICQELGITLSNYWQLIHRSKLVLRECLKKKWFDDTH